MISSLPISPMSTHLKFDANLFYLEKKRLNLFKQTQLLILQEFMNLIWKITISY